MHTITSLAPYRDEDGNQIAYRGPRGAQVKIRFLGANNRLVIAPDVDVTELRATFHGDNGVARIGRAKGADPLPDAASRPLRVELRVGHDSRIRIGQGVSCASVVLVSAVEGRRVVIGDDVMFASHVEVRCDDTHAIYDVRSGLRANRARSIRIGDHVWLAKHVVVMGGVTVGSGSVIGLRSVVTRSIPNNCVAVGAPARVVRRHVAWERPVVFTRRPGSRRPEPGEKTEAFWAMTVEAPAVTSTSRLARVGRRARAVLRRVLPTGRGRDLPASR